MLAHSRLPLYSVRLVLLLLGALTVVSVFVLAQDDTPDLPNLPISSDVTYIIQTGDTLDEIGALFDVRVACIVETNPDAIDRDGIIRPGDPLVLRVECPAYDGAAPVPFPRTDSPGRSGEDGTYAVRQGDTLDGIGRTQDISVEALREANGLGRFDPLPVGLLLTLPEDAPPFGDVPPGRVLREVNADAAESIDSALATAPGEAYVIQRGDTLDVIGQAFDVSVAALQIANNLGYPYSQTIFPGDVLIIPEGAPAYGLFPVIPGQTVPGGGADSEAEAAAVELADNEVRVQVADTLDGIARELDVSVEALRLENGIVSARQIVPGQVLVIPEDAPPYGTAPDIDEPAGAVLAPGEVYVIQLGDTLDGIAAQFDVDSTCLIAQNEIVNVRGIRAGQTLGIPADCPAYMGFDVVPGRAPFQPTPVPTTAPDSAGAGSFGVPTATPDA